MATLINYSVPSSLDLPLSSDSSIQQPLPLPFQLSSHMVTLRAFPPSSHTSLIKYPVIPKLPFCHKWSLETGALHNCSNKQQHVSCFPVQPSYQPKLVPQKNHHRISKFSLLFIRLKFSGFCGVWEFNTGHKTLKTRLRKHWQDIRLIIMTSIRFPTLVKLIAYRSVGFKPLNLKSMILLEDRSNRISIFFFFLKGQFWSWVTLKLKINLSCEMTKKQLTEKRQW